MAGTNEAFDPTVFKDAIHLAMEMGAANLTEEQVTFRWTPEETYADEDVAGRPYSWTATPTTTVTHADTIVPVALVWALGASQDGTSMASFDNSRATLTLLDEDYANVVGADTAVIGGNTYDIQVKAPPVGLFEVTVHTLELVARDES